MKKLFSRFLALVFAVPIALFVWIVYTLIFADDRVTGSKEHVPSTLLAEDCPITLPSAAVDISYCYDLHWQGGGYVVRYRLPVGDLHETAETILKTQGKDAGALPPWQVIDRAHPSPSVPKHRFDQVDWFVPHRIQRGSVSASGGMLGEPRVWIDAEAREIYVINQN